MNLPDTPLSRNQKLQLYKDEVERLEGILEQHGISYAEDEDTALSTDELTVAEVEELAESTDDLDALNELFNNELAGKNRKTAKESIADRITELGGKL